jgi:hypothetical protein
MRGVFIFNQRSFYEGVLFCGNDYGDIGFGVCAGTQKVPGGYVAPTQCAKNANKSKNRGINEKVVRSSTDDIRRVLCEKYTIGE